MRPSVEQILCEVVRQQIDRLDYRDYFLCSMHLISFVFGVGDIYFWNIRTAVRGGLGMDKSLKLCRTLAIYTFLAEWPLDGEINASSISGIKVAKK